MAISSEVCKSISKLISNVPFVSCHILCDPTAPKSMFSIDQQGAAKTCNVEVSFGIPIAKIWLPAAVLSWSSRTSGG